MIHQSPQHLMHQSPQNLVHQKMMQSPPNNRILPIPGQFPSPSVYQSPAQYPGYGSPALIQQQGVQFGAVPMIPQQGLQFGTVPMIPSIQSPIRQQPMINQMPMQFSPQAMKFGAIQPPMVVQQPPMVVQQNMLRASPMSTVLQTQNIQQSVVIAQQIPSQIIERIEQPLQVVDLFQVEEPWRLRVEQLEITLRSFQGRTNTSVQVQEQINYVQDDTKNNETQTELSQAYAQIQQLINQIKIFQDENQTSQRTIDEKKRRVSELEELLRLKEKEIEDTLDNIDHLNGQLDSQSLETEEKHSYLIKEVNVWKQKFVELNKEFHHCQEEFMLAEAELDNLQQSQVKNSSSIKTTTTTTETSSRRAQRQ